MMDDWKPIVASGISMPDATIRGLHYVHVIGYDDVGNEKQLWAGEMNQVPQKGDRLRLRVGKGHDSYRLLWVEAVAWPLFCDEEGRHGQVGQPFVYVS
jgi:hypothetical protein